MPFCPYCGRILVVTPLNNNWYCSACQTYPLNALNHSHNSSKIRICESRKSLLRAVSNITEIIGFLLITPFIIGIFFLNMGIKDIFNPYIIGQADYLNFSKGIILISVIIVSFMFLKYFKV